MTRLTGKLKEIQLAIFDLDGVIYRGDTLIQNVDKVIEKLKDLSIKVVFNSNNSTTTREAYVERLKNFNIECTADEIYTSASISASELIKLKKNALIYVIGEDGIIEELKRVGHRIFNRNLNYKDVDFVLVGLDRKFNYEKLSLAQKCIMEGKAKFYATNTDATLPSHNGLLPGAGVMVKGVEICTNLEPIMVFGKPNPHGIELILKKYNIASEFAIIFGDRLNTDILAGNRAGIKTALVLTGVTSEKDVLPFPNESNKHKLELVPNFIFKTLDDIFED